MSNTAHQREMEDLRRAGLNPLLSARHGGASAPAGAQAPTPNFAESVNSAVAGMRVKMDSAMQAAQIRDVNSASALKDAQTNDLNATQADRIDLLIAQKQQAIESGRLSSGQASKVQDEISVLKAQRDNIRANTAATVADSEKKKLIGGFYELGNKAVEGAKGPLKKFDKFLKEKFRRGDGKTGRW